ncbi:MAG: TPM domain-containing protein, partial [Rhodothermaceae bacterium]|nr:TPM domain-containing protein [Rhodothermaceae bacterium]
MLRVHQRLILIHKYRRFCWFVPVALVALVMVHGSVLAQERNQIVVDEAGMLSSQEEQRLALSLRQYADSTSTQIAIRIIQSLEGRDIAEYATELGQSLGVGQAEHDNGVLILVSEQDRAVFIAVGYGLEGAIPDALAGQIVRGIIEPNFRGGRFYAGLAGAVDALTLAAGGEYTAESLPVARGSGRGGDLGGLGLFFMVVVFAVFMMLSRGGGRGGSGRHYRGDSIIPLMFLLGHASGRGSGGFGGGGSFG